MAAAVWGPGGEQATGARLAVCRLRGGNTERDADALHVLMGVAMAGMLELRLTPVPVIAWRVVFTAAAAWFAWQAIRSARQAGGSRGAHPAAHAVECAATVYMLLPVGSWPSGRYYSLVKCWKHS